MNNERIENMIDIIGREKYEKLNYGNIAQINESLIKYKDLVKNGDKNINKNIELLILNAIKRYEILKRDGCFIPSQTTVINKTLKKSINGSKIKVSIHGLNSTSNSVNITELLCKILKYFAGVKYYKKDNYFTFEYIYRDLIFEYIETLVYVLFMSRTVYLEKF